MPSRADMAIVYFTALLEHDKTHLCLKQTQELLEKSPDSPVGLWFYGVSLLKDRRFPIQKGMGFLQRSLHKGIGRFMPLSELEKKQILEYQA